MGLFLRDCFKLGEGLCGAGSTHLPSGNRLLGAHRYPQGSGCSAGLRFQSRVTLSGCDTVLLSSSAIVLAVHSLSGIAYCLPAMLSVCLGCPAADNWDGSEYKGSPFNILTLLGALFVLVPVAGLVVAYFTYGTLWG